MMTKLRKLSTISSRNVFRNKRRTLLTLSILVLGSCGLILVGGFFDFIIGALGDYFIYSQTGHLQVNQAHYSEQGTSEPFQYMIEDVDAVQQLIEKQPQVRFTVPRLKFGGLLSSRDASISILALGVDPVKESKLGSHPIFMKEGTSSNAMNMTAGQSLSADDPYGILVGRGLMKSLNLNIGDPVTLLITREFGAIDGADFHVRGEFTTQLKDFDERVIKVNLATLQDLFNVPKKVHSLLVVLNNTEELETMTGRLTNLFLQAGFPLEIIQWQDQASYYTQSKDFLRSIYVTVQFILGIVFFFSIANTINMNLFERLREFGTMMALGNTRSTIVQMIMLEGTYLGIMGASLGLIFGYLAAVIISKLGIPMPPPPMGSYAYEAEIALNGVIFFNIFLVVLFSTVLASIVPAYRASHFRIIAALGHN